MSVASKTKKILIIDDEKPIVDLISDVLEKYSYEPIVATKWTEAIDAIGNASPDLILLDLKMPTIDGPSLLEFIRKEGIELPVIIVSGFITDEVAADLSALGVSGFVKKPFKVVQLKEAIESVIGPPTQVEEAATTPERDETPTIDSLYTRPPEPAPEPQEAPPTDASTGADAGVLDAFKKLEKNTSTQDIPVEGVENPDKDDQVLQAFNKLSKGNPRTAESPADTRSTEPPAAPDGDRLLQAFEKLGPEKQPAPEPASSPPSQAPLETAPVPVPESAQPNRPQTPLPPSPLDPVSLGETIGTNPPGAIPSAGFDDVRPHHGHRRPPRSRARRSKNLMMYGAITVVCIVVASFLAVIKMWEAKGGADALKKRATKSMQEQGKEEIFRELLKNK
jgi:CheY-like chemotaxis protein